MLMRKNTNSCIHHERRYEYDDLEKDKTYTTENGPNGGFTLHLPDEEQLLKNIMFRKDI